MVPRFWIVGIVLIICLLIMPDLMVAQNLDGPPRWSAPELLGDGWFPSIATDKTNTAHIVWYAENEDGNDLLYYRQRQSYRVGSELYDIISPGNRGFTVRNGIGVTSDGILAIAYRQRTEHFAAVAPVARANSAQEWINHIGLSGGYYLDLAVDSSDIIHMVSSVQSTNLGLPEYQDVDNGSIRERFPCAFCADLMYFRSTDHGRSWSSGINISQTVGGSERPQLKVGASGRLYLGWTEGRDWYAAAGEYEDVRIVYSDDEGLSWSDTIVFSGTQPGLHPTQLAYTEMLDGALFAVWRYDKETDLNIYYQISHDVGATWSPPVAVPGILADNMFDSQLDRYSIITDLDGAVHLFAVGYDPVTEEGPTLYHLEYRQGQWLPPYRVYSDPNVLRPEWPVVAVGPQNDLHLAWFIRVGERKYTVDVSGLQIFYAHRTPTQPDNPVLVAYAPTATPVPRVVAVPAFEATSTTVPTLAPLDKTLNVETNHDLYAIQTLLGAIIAVSILCGGVLILFGFRLRSF